MASSETEEKKRCNLVFFKDNYLYMPDARNDYRPSRVLYNPDIKLDYEAVDSYITTHSFITKSEELDKLKLICLKYGGLCEVLCEYYIAVDYFSSEKLDENLKLLKQPNRGLDQATLEYLNEHADQFHLMFDERFLQLAKKYFEESDFELECNLLTNQQQKTLDHDILNKSLDKTTAFYSIDAKLDALEPGSFIKFMSFSWMDSKLLEGHSSLIRKNESGFIFFDCMLGVFLNLDKEQLKLLLINVMIEKTFSIHSMPQTMRLGFCLLDRKLLAQCMANFQQYSVAP